MTNSISKEEYTLKITLVFWKFCELELYFEPLKIRKYLEREESLKLYKDY